MFSSLWRSKPAKEPERPSLNNVFPEPEKKLAPEKMTKELERIQKHFESLPVPLVALVFFTLGFACSTGGAVLYARCGRRIQNSDWVTPDLLTNKRWIRGVVTSVGDPDNFRLFHTPPFGGWRWPFKFRRVPTIIKELKDQTLHIRIAGVDAPEAGHWGKPEQPYAAESLTWLREKILGKVVYCQLIRKDRYNRVVSTVYLAPPFLASKLPGHNLSLEMLKAGCATIYEQADAEYGTETIEKYRRLETTAKAAGRGMWAEGITTETPAEYKRRYSSPGPQEPITTSTTTLGRTRPKAAGPRGWFSRLFF